MEAWTHDTIMWLLEIWALPKVGLSAIFIISLVSATLLPLGSEPAVLAYVAVEPTHFWYAVAVATIGNTIGGAIRRIRPGSRTVLIQQLAGPG